MRIYRLTKLSELNMDAVTVWFAQARFFRYLFGGCWVKMNGGDWEQCWVMLVLADGTSMYRTEGGVSFHETNVSITKLESYI